MIESTFSDIVSVLLESSRLKATVFANPRTAGDWQIAESTPSPTFHLVVRGTAWLHVESQEPVELAAGDLAVVLRGHHHRLAAQADSGGSGTRLPPPEASGGRIAEIICGRFDFGEALGSEILEELPAFLVVGSDAMRLESLARLLAAEAAGSAPGRQLALDRLSDLLFIALIRHLMERGSVTRGLLAGLGDPRIARALAAMHGDAAAAWTLPSLAAQAGMSRTLFARRFHELMGTTPLRWLTRLRMEKAQAILALGQRTVGSVAIDVGYESEAAFRRAFNRWRRSRRANTV